MCALADWNFSSSSFFILFSTFFSLVWDAAEFAVLFGTGRFFFPPPNSNANLQANSFSETFPKEKCVFFFKYFIICLPALPAASAAGDIRWIAEIE